MLDIGIAAGGDCPEACYSYGVRVFGVVVVFKPRSEFWILEVKQSVTDFLEVG